jgi:uncharacterized protein YdhG (YjbR/CyaY superfamily)
MGPAARSVGEYLRKVRPDQRAALQRLRKAILAAAPGAEECISYGMPGFRRDGKMLVWFGATAKHCAFYPGGMSPAVRRELSRWDTSKGTIRFQPDLPLPLTVIRRLVQARVVQTGGRRG